jgi:hypothetical protein
MVFTERCKREDRTGQGYRREKLHIEYGMGKGAWEMGRYEFMYIHVGSHDERIGGRVGRRVKTTEGYRCNDRKEKVAVAVHRWGKWK